MSILSDKLQFFIDQRGLSIGDLAKRSGIERSTLYQYIKDRRPFQNKSQLETIMLELHLTPEERAEVLDAFEITRIGVKKYNRRRKVREIIESLLTLDKRDPKLVKTEFQKDLTEIENQGLFKGELEVNRIVHQVIRKTVEMGGGIEAPGSA